MTDGTAPAIASKQADSTRISINKWSDFNSIIYVDTASSIHRHNPLPPLLLIIQRNCRRHHHHQRRHRKEPPLQHHHYYCRRQHLLSKPSDIIFSNAPIFFRPIDKLLSQLHYDLFIVSSFVIIINRIIESGCRCIDIIIIIIIIAAASLPPTGRHNIFQRFEVDPPADNYSSSTSITNHLRQSPSSSSSTASSEVVAAAADDYYCSSSSSFSTGPLIFQKVIDVTMV